ncbi:YHS domain-containing (seleno)protein [uncultured Abyssibacter sp.]|uniref:YHS domain-containing (seleno)protein n=1 Tax=uncultured Abyssibacter sp. TaxID=2320202 RepID=UPI0032B2A898
MMRNWKSLVNAAALGMALLVTAPAMAGQKIYTGWFSDVAIKGYDPVAYFTDGKPVEGKEAFETQWEGATWRFASAEHRDLFAANPEQYAPQYGGHCAFAVAKGNLVKIDPEAWTIVDGKLYLNYSLSVRDQWLADRDGFIEQADRQWPQIGQE